MNVFDVHVNRYPTDGTVAYRHYNAGKFGHAAAEKASLDNEQSVGRPGHAARQGPGPPDRGAGRASNRHRPSARGSRSGQGERMGMIRFGSRVDLFVPVGARVLVQAWVSRTRAGVTVVAEWS